MPKVVPPKSGPPDHFWQPKLVPGDHFWLPKLVPGDHFWQPKVVPPCQKWSHPRPILAAKSGPPRPILAAKSGPPRPFLAAKSGPLRHILDASLPNNTQCLGDLPQVLKSLNYGRLLIASYMLIGVCCGIKFTYSYSLCCQIYCFMVIFILYHYSVYIASHNYRNL